MKTVTRISNYNPDPSYYAPIFEQRAMDAARQGDVAYACVNLRASRPQMTADEALAVVLDARSR